MVIESLPQVTEPEAGPEAREMMRLEALDEVAERGLEEVSQLEGLDYHDREHSENVAKRTEAILRVLQTVNPDAISNDDIALAKAAAAWHDAVQQSERNPDGTRKRLRGFYEGDNPAGEEGNERKSFEGFWEAVSEHTDKEGRPLFTERDRTYAEQIIAATYPDFKMSQFPPAEQEQYPDRPKQGLRVSQPHLEAHLEAVRRGEEHLNYAALAIGLADLSFADGGDKEFREVHAKKSEDLVTMSDQERSAFAQKILGWQESQVEFLRMQKLRFTENVSTLSSEEQTALAKIGSNLDTRIEEQIERVKKMQSEYAPEALANPQSFLRLVKEVGYDINM